MSWITQANLPVQYWTREIPYGTRKALGLLQLGFLHRQHRLSNMIFEIFFILFLYLSKYIFEDIRDMFVLNVVTVIYYYGHNGAF